MLSHSGPVVRVDDSSDSPDFFSSSCAEIATYSSISAPGCC